MVPRITRGSLALLLLALTVAAPAAAATPRLVYGCGPNLCDVQADGKSRRALTSDGTWQRPYAFPTRSRDGARMAFVGRDARVYVANGLARKRKRLGDHTGRPRLHRDGKQVMVISFQGTATVVCRVPAGGGSSPCVTGDGLWSWGPGVQVMTAIGGPDRTSYVRSYDVTAERVKERTTIAPRRADSYFDGTPSVSPDGRLVAVPEVVAGRRALALYDMRTRRHVRDVTKGQPDADPSWSADGKQLVFVRGARKRTDIYGEPALGRIMRVARGGGRASQVAREGRHPHWGS